MASNYKLLKHISTSINLMESFGLVPHRSFLNDNIFTLEDGTEIDNNNFRKYERTHNIKDKTKLNKIHIVYCIVLLISKIIFVSINGIYLTIPEKHFSDTNISSSFVSVLFFLVNSLMFLIMTSFPIYSLILHLTQKVTLLRKATRIHTRPIFTTFYLC